MSAGQTQQRKILTANQAIQPNETNMADEPTGTRNNYLNNVLDGYQGNASKKVVSVNTESRLLTSYFFYIIKLSYKTNTLNVFI